MSSLQSQFESIGKRAVVATHRRSGTHLFIDLLRKQFAALRSWKRLGERPNAMYLTLELLNQSGITGRPSAELPGLELDAVLDRLKRADRPIVKTHNLPDYSGWKPKSQPIVDEIFRDADVFYVHRDPRDALASLHCYMQYFEPSARCSLGEFVRQPADDLPDLSRIAYWRNHVESWRSLPNVNVVLFKDVIRNTRSTLESVSQVLDVRPEFREPLLPRRLRNIWESRWLRFFSTCPEPTTILSDGYNRRKAEDWRTALTESDRAFVHEEAGDLLIELGYEDSDEWVTADSR